MSDNDVIYIDQSDVVINIDTVSSVVSTPTPDEEISVNIEHCRYEVTPTNQTGISPGWPFGNTKNRITLPVGGGFGTVDFANVPSIFRAIKWLFFVSDDENDIAVQGEVSCFRQGDVVRYSIFGILGDSSAGMYVLDINIDPTDNSRINLMFRNTHTSPIDVRAVKIGLHT